MEIQDLKKFYGFLALGYKNMNIKRTSKYVLLIMKHIIIKH